MNTVSAAEGDGGGRIGWESREEPEDTQGAIAIEKSIG